MRMLLVLFATILHACSARADFTFSATGSGSYSAGTPVLGPDGWQVDLTVTVSGSGVYLVMMRKQLPGDSIDYVNITANRSPGATGTGAVEIEPASFSSDTIPRVLEVNKVAGNAPLGLSMRNIGQLGDVGSGVVVNVDSIDVITVLKRQFVTGYTGHV